MLPENDKKENLILLGAHYYLWYGKPAYPVLGMGEWRSGYTNHPLLGEYNSRDFEVVNKHFDWAREAGIDFFAMEWWNPNSWDDITLRDYFLPKLKNSEIKFCIHYDAYLALNLFRNSLSYDFNTFYIPGKTKGQKFLEDLEYLADNYFHHPQYLKINGKPVVIIYNTSAFRNVSEYFEKLKANMEKRNIKLFLIADVICWAGIKISLKNLPFLWENSPKETIKVFLRALRRLSLKSYEKDFSLNRYFDGITGYNMYAVNRIEPDFLKNVDKVYQKFYQYTLSNNLSFIPNVMPGYDDRKLKGFNRPVLERKDGKFYKEFWEVAKKYLDPSLKMVLITTFNEWHEGTEIEPSKEYGTKYLELTKSFII
jgi:hypothetical protein